MEYSAMTNRSHLDELTRLRAENERLRSVLPQARVVIQDALNAFGPCDHDFGICNCDMQRAIDCIDDALKEPKT